ncbi:hypothetical protein PW5551_10260 [Petrotoga sp. 9PW.55.5.1]|nr:hypothetical protein PW5551_10260 [Petrotoga sp. 9PW.55.5.1]
MDAAFYAADGVVAFIPLPREVRKMRGENIKKKSKNALCTKRPSVLLKKFRIDPIVGREP